MKRSLAAALIGLLAVGPGMAPGAAPEQRAVERTGDSRSCVSHAQIGSTIVEDPQNIRFEMLGRRVYRNRLPAACPELRQVAQHFSTLAFDLHGASVCQGDLVRIGDLSRVSGANLEGAIACPLGAFERLPDRAARR